MKRTEKDNHEPKENLEAEDILGPKNNLEAEDILNKVKKLDKPTDIFAVISQTARRRRDEGEGKEEKEEGGNDH